MDSHPKDPSRQEAPGSPRTEPPLPPPAWGAWAAAWLGASGVFGAASWLASGRTSAGQVPDGSWLAAGAVTGLTSLLLLLPGLAAWSRPGATSGRAGPWIATAAVFALLSLPLLAVGAAPAALGLDAETTRLLFVPWAVELSLGTLLRVGVAAVVLRVPLGRLPGFAACLTATYQAISLGLQLILPGLALWLTTALLEVALTREERPFATYFPNLAKNLPSLALALGGATAGAIGSGLVVFVLEGPAGLLDPGAASIGASVASEALSLLPWMLGLHLANRRYTPAQPLPG